MAAEPVWRNVHHALFNGNGVAKRLLVAVVAFSSVVTTVITAIDLVGQYRASLRDIDAAFAFVRDSYVPTLARSVWLYDAESLNVQLQGLLRLPDIEFAAIETEGRTRWSAGKVLSERTRQASLELVHAQPGGAQPLGRLQLVAGVDRVLARLWSEALGQLVANGVKTLLVAGFLLLVFQILVTRHLTRVAGFVRALDPAAARGLDATLALDRPAHGRWRPDMLDTLVAAINAMLASLRRARQDIDHSQALLTESEATLRSSEARLRALTEHASARICELDADGRITFFNRENRIDGRPVIGSRAADWLPPDLRPLFELRLQKAFAGGGRQHFELSFQTMRGSPGSWIFTIALIRADDGRAPSVALTVLDITELKQVEQAVRDANRLLESRVRERTAALEVARDEAERASRAKTELLSRMSHELRTPLNAILGFTQVLEMADPDEPRQRGWVGEIRRAGEHLLSLIDELLDLASVEVGKLSLRLAPVPVAALLDEALALVGAAAAARGITPTVMQPDAAACVLADATRARQILVNLLSNAVKYNRDGGRVEVAVRACSAQRVRISVSDSGLGLPAERREALFQPFERLGREHSDIAGSGIGLALSRRLALLMNGELGVDSVDGEGSTFWLELPVPLEPAAAAPALPPAAAAAAAPAAGLRVLYIEDNNINVAVMQAFFDRLPGYEMLLAGDGPTGLALARSARPDAILLDIHLPKMDGYAVLRELGADAATRDIPVIAVSADAMPADLARGQAAGFAGYVAKPIVFTQLAALLNSLCTPG